MVKPLSIIVVSSTRADFGYLRFTMKRLLKDPNFRPIIVATGTHLSQTMGNTLTEFERYEISVEAKVDMGLRGDTPLEIALAIGEGTKRFGALFSEKNPDAILIMGDRFELLSVVSAALPFSIPVIHLSGGDITEGVMDDAIRHAVTKLSSFHLPASLWHANHLRQLGEEEWRIRVVGEPTLEFLHEASFLSHPSLEENLKIKINSDTVVVTYHPETLSLKNKERDLQSLLKFLNTLEGSLVVTGPNADPGSQYIREELKRFCAEKAERVYVESLGHQRFLSLLKHVGLMIGNSSSGLVEAPSFGLPVINIGDRQKGRLKAGNVIDASADFESLQTAFCKAKSPSFLEACRGIQNPYGDGNSSDLIMKALLEWDCALREKPNKKFIPLS